MRLWSINPKYLDTKGLVALWREALLAQNVLTGNTKGYKNHPQLNRFKNTANPLGAIAYYLKCVAKEADTRGYNFDKTKINNNKFNEKITVTSGQISHESNHLLSKLKLRDKNKYEILCKLEIIDTHPLFVTIFGDIESWEILK